MMTEELVNRLAALADKLEKDGRDEDAREIDQCIHLITFGSSEKNIQN